MSFHKPCVAKLDFASIRGESSRIKAVKVHTAQCHRFNSCDSAISFNENHTYAPFLGIAVVDWQNNWQCGCIHMKWTIK